MSPDAASGDNTPFALSLALALDAPASGQADIHVRLGQQLQRQGELAQALGHYLRATQLDPDCIAGWCGMAATMEDRLQYEHALAAYRQALEYSPDSASVHHAMGRTLVRAERLPEAEVALRHAIQLNPNLAEAWNTLGMVKEMAGALAEATAHQRKAIELDPTLAEAYTGLPLSGDGALDERDVGRLRGLLGGDGLPADTAIPLHFVLAHYYDREGCYDDAFAHAVQGNRLRRAEFERRGRAYDAAVHQRNIDTVIKVFDQSFFDSFKNHGSDSKLPVFVIGIPRSGTTLLEQILCSHPQVHGVGEVNEVLAMLYALPDELGQPETGALACVQQMTELVARRFAARYLARVREGSGDALRITNKALGNFPLVGFIWSLFPQATFFDCRRDPRDVAVSCFFNDLRRIPWTCDLGFIATVLGDHARMMAHWQRVLPVPLHTVRYEEMVQHCEAVSRQAVEHCGLDWHPACLDFHLNRRPIFNASRRQVRRALYADSVARWRNYERHLGSIVELAEPARATAVPCR